MIRSYYILTITISSTLENKTTSKIVVYLDELVNAKKPKEKGVGKLTLRTLVFHINIKPSRSEK